MAIVSTGGGLIQAAAGGAPGAEHAQAEPQAAHAADDNVVDADFKEVKKS